MKTLLLLLLPISLFAQSFVTEVPDWDHNDISNIKINYVDSAEWVHMDHGGTYNTVKDTYLEYSGTFYEIHIKTGRASHHGGYIIKDNGIDIDTVITQNENQSRLITYFKEWRTQRNHTIQLRPLDERPFVIDQFVTFTNSNPRYETTYKDSIEWNIIKLDTIIPNPVDSSYIVPIPIDSPYVVPKPIDSIYYVYDTVTAYVPDTTLVAVERSDIYVDCAETNCPDFNLKNILLWLYVIVGLLVIGFVITIIVKRKL